MYAEKDIFDTAADTRARRNNAEAKVRRLNYRPEIDGLRAVAVSLVILHHLGFAVVSGGYIGVDVFFVISGYLITSIISIELDERRFSIAGFYKRRIIRLAPAFFLIMGMTTLTSFWIMLPAELVEFSKSVIFSTLLSANVFMWRDVGGYFGVQGEHVPLLHLWSLAVEEQFYVLWPVGLLLIRKIVRPRRVWIIALITALLGLWISEWGVENYRAAAYYLMPTRAFEFLFGAFLAGIPNHSNSREANWLALFGLVLIGFSAVTYTKEAFFPGLNALAPCLGSGLLIAFAGRQNRVGNFLASGPLNFMGRISYSAYLWHWPLIAFFKIYEVEIDIYVATFIVGVTLLLSSLTYWFVESPSKKALSYPAIKVASVGFALPVAALLALSVLADVCEGWPGRFDASLTVRSAAVLSYSNKKRGRCNEGNVENPLPPDKCILGVKHNGVDILLIGDSHANHFTGMLDVLAKDADLRGYDITQSQTMYLPEVRRFYTQDGHNIEHYNFYKRNRVLKTIIGAGRYKFIVLAGAFAAGINNDEYHIDESPQLRGRPVFVSRFEKAIQEIIAVGAAPVVFKGNPTYARTIYNCTLNNQRFNLTKTCTMDKSEYIASFSDWNNYLSMLIEKYPSLRVIDPALVMCDASFCFSELKGVPLYRDSGHLNDVGSRLIGEIYLQQFGNPFKTPIN